ncbi:MAG TPA: sugar phosphate isomerase/epimerase family protein [Aggregatilineales bacterium]|nr:sugar phosphate isomerase/epimerase family protein [Aggregatilineales bacterium]
MKLGVSMWSVVKTVESGQMNLPKFIDFAARQGVEGVELLDYFWKDEKVEIPQVKKQIADSGLKLAVYSIGNDFFQPDASARAGVLAELKHGVDVANQLGVNLMRVFSGSHKEGYKLEDGLAWIIEGLTAGAAYAQQHGVTLALENHGLMAGRSDQVRAIIEKVNSPALRANLDTGNFLLVGQNPVDAARELGPLVALVHLKDFRRAGPADTVHVYRGLDGTGYTGTVTGEGMVDLPKIIDILRSAGYTGWLSLEYEGGDDPLTIGVPRSLEAARKLLK